MCCRVGAARGAGAGLAKAGIEMWVGARSSCSNLFNGIDDGFPWGFPGWSYYDWDECLQKISLPIKVKTVKDF
jgi:hypothetical protein